MLRLAALLVIVMLAAPVAWAGFDDGVAAYDQGDFAAAVAEWTPLAEAGDVRAQYRLGRMFEKGEGVARDDVRAAAWYLAAAQRGETDAQVDLGILYAEGRGVAKDPAEAYMWWEIAELHGNTMGGAMQVLIERGMSLADTDEAKRRAEAWEPK